MNMAPSQTALIGRLLVYKAAVVLPFSHDVCMNVLDGREPVQGKGQRRREVKQIAFSVSRSCDYSGTSE